MPMFRNVLLAMLCLVAAAHAGELAPRERARIDHLLAIVGSLQHAQFIRNGTAYDSATAVSHLRLKWRAAGTRVQTAEDFIRDCASQSSLTGQPYEIRFSDGRTVAAADFLRQQLREFDAQNPER
ncbi:MAG TPA: DUF5329 domain-containing protein [Steroidobacteraceae bacterium]|nr:DUF5329 domain-containing protein [Steroidobacteraceae bacterium]